MCARRFLLAIFWLTLLVVAGAFAIFQFGGDVLIKSTIPKGHFVAPPPNSGPDYSIMEFWISHPLKDEDSPANWQPTEERLGPPHKSGTTQIFYIHPTTYLERDRWNAPFHPDRQTEFRTRLFVQTQGSPFFSAGFVWAPRYRQAAFGAFLLNGKDANQALNLAFSDVERAFDQFVAGLPAGEPIILVGHSQGALHLMRLLRQRVAGKPLADRIVAAYVVGWPLSVTTDVPGLGLPPCRSPDQAGCILSWMSFAEPANPELVLHSYEGSAGLTGAKRKRDDILCVNPLTGTQDGAAPPAANNGTLVPSADLRSATLQPGLVGARCDKGLLILEGAIPPLGPYVLPGNNYHVYDFALFWDAIRADSVRRLAARQ